MRHFLLLYDTQASRLLAEPQQFGDSTLAVDAYFAAEVKFGRQPLIQVILIGSDSLETVKITHGNFFRRTSMDAMVERLRAAGH